MSMSEMEYTRILISVKDELGKEFQQLRSREEYDRLRKELTDIVSQLKKETGVEAGIYSDPDVSDALTKLYRLLSNALPAEKTADPGFPSSKEQFDNILKVFDKKAESLKTSAELDKSFLAILKKNFSQYKSSDDYIRRLVLKRLMRISPEYVCKKGNPGDSAVDDGGYALNSEHNRILDEKVFEKDSDGHYCLSTRLLILKQFIKQFGWCEGVKHSNKDADGEGYNCLRLKFLIEESGKSQEEFASEINESVFDDLKEMEVDLNDEEQYEYFNKITEALKSGKITYSEDLTKRHIELLAGLQLKYGKTVKDRGGVITIAQKAKNESALIKAAESIGSASFGKVSPNREYLYIFAVAFEMTVSKSAALPSSESELSYETDIRKNLFYDFYSDNLLNALLNDDKDDKDKEKVSGYGINYKNFAEICYLYYIGQTSLSPLQKLVSARDTIEYCAEQAGNSFDYYDPSDVDDEAYYTESYERGFFDKILGFKEEELKRHLLDNYECYYKKTQDVDMSNEHRTAAELYDTLLSYIDNRRAKIQIEGLETSEITDDEETGIAELDKIIKKINQVFVSEHSLRGFWDRWNKHFYGFTIEEFEKNEKSNQHLNYDCLVLMVSRAELLVCCCNYIISKMCSEEKDKIFELAYNFGKFYDYFTKEIMILNYRGLNDVLLQCGFMEINHKNLFDIIVMYLTYKNVLLNQSLA